MTPTELLEERAPVEVTALTGAETRAFVDVPQEKSLEDAADAQLRAAEEAAVEAVFEGGRPSIAAGFAMVAVAVMVGGMFAGWQPRLFATVGGLQGVLMGYSAARSRKGLTAQLMAFLGIMGVTLLAAIAGPHGFADLAHLTQNLQAAANAGRVLRPPAPFDPGWRPLIVFSMAELGFAAAWFAIEFKRAALAILIPLPVLVLAAISQAKDVQIIDGIAAFMLMAVAFTALFRDTSGEQGAKLSLEFEARRALRSAPLIVIVLVGLFFASRSGFLLPAPAYDPTQAAQLPKPVSISDAVDKQLMTIKSSIHGPWRMGVLDVYDGQNFRLPPYAQSRLNRIPATGEVNSILTPGVEAEFHITGLEGAVLPIPTRPIQIAETGNQLLFDSRSGIVRLGDGELHTGITYRVVASAPPTPDELKTAQIDASDTLDLKVPTEPPEVAAFIKDAPPSGWPRADYVRKQFLKTVTLAGAGLPGAVPPSKVVDMISGSKEGDPFQVVAGEVLLERWAGIPARIAYGFDKGAVLPDGTDEIRPKNGSSWLEVNFKGLGFFPVTGAPLHAKATLGGKNPVNTEQNILPSNDIAVNFFIPVRQITQALLYEQLRPVVALAVGLLLCLGLLYASWPVIYKSLRRARRRSWAHRNGERARIAVAYAEFREMAIDLGDGHYLEPPLTFLQHVAADEEHEEFAWLVSRMIWGDEAPNEDDVNAAEELSSSLRARLVRAQPGTVRALALFSRLSLKHPYPIGGEFRNSRRQKVAA